MMSLHSLKLSKAFPPCPPGTGKPLPFSIDEFQFTVWLDTLSAQDEIAKCQVLLNVLQTLNTAYPPERKLITGRTRLFFLDKIGAVLTPATTLLTHFPSVSDISPDPDISLQEMARSELSVWCSLELANAYSLLGTEDCFKENGYYSIEEKTSILANGLQAMGRGLLYICQTYSKPYSYFWYKCFQFYRLARLYRLNDGDFNASVALIENAFKRLLIFALSNTNQFSPSEMRTIYELLGHYAGYTSLLKSVPKKKFNGIPSIHLKSGGPPTISNDDSDHHDPDQLFIATVTVASKILEATNDRRSHHLPTDRLMLLRLAKTLTLNEQRKDTRETTDGNHLGIVGFGNILEFLRGKEIEKQNMLAGTGKFDPVKPGEIRELDFELSKPVHKEDDNILDYKSEPQSEKTAPFSFQVVEFTNPDDIWKNKPNVQKGSQESNIRLLDRSVRGYGLLWTDNLIKPKVGSLVAIINQNLTIGLIRWLAQSKETGMFMGVERLGYQATVVKVTNPGYPDIMANAIYLTHEEGEPTNPTGSLILINKDFRPSEFIFIHKNFKNIRYRLTKQLHLTSFINHVEIVRSH